MSKQFLNERGWLVGSRFAMLLTIGTLWALPVSARAQPVVFVGIVEPPQTDLETGLSVGDVDRLYDVLEQLWNDPAALGLTSSAATIQLAEHAIYRLDSSPGRPEAGRVKLPLGAGLVGGNQYTDDRDEDGNPGADGIPDAIGIDALGNKIFASHETILDGRSLTGDRAVIEAGLANVIRNLTVWGARGTTRPGAEIRLLLTDQDNVGSLEVDGVICEKGRRGLHVSGGNGAQMYLTARRSIFRDHTDLTDVGWGVQVSSMTASEGPVLLPTLYDNRLYNNRIGAFLASQGTRDGDIVLNSHHNVIEENRNGMQSLIRDLSTPQGSLRNRMRIHSIKDMIWNNSAGGVTAIGYQRDASGVEIRDNETELQFLETHFVKLTVDGEFDGPQNRRGTPARRTDLRIVGAMGTLGVSELTSGMRVSLLQRQTTSSLMKTTYDSNPQPIVIDDNAPDVVDITVTGNPKAYMRTNEGVNELDDHLFSQGE